MSGKEGERSKQAKKSQSEKRNGQEEAGDGEDCYSEEVMRSFLSDEDNRPVMETYQKLMTVMNQHADEQSNIDAHTLQLVVLQANEAFASVKRPREGAIDACLLRQCGRLGELSLETSQSSLAVFSSRDFAEKLVNFARTLEGSSSENDEEHCLLNRIGKNASYMFRSVSGVQPFFSAVEWEKPPPQQKSRQKKDSEDKKEAQKVAVLKDHDGEEEAMAVSWMCKILKQCYAAAGKKPLPFFKFVVNPTSFSRTVENLFHISLLVREQYAELTEDEDGLPVILPVQSTATRGEDRQCILPMDEWEWRELIKIFEINHAMIPPRRSHS